MDDTRETYFKTIEGGLSEEVTFLLSLKDELKVLSVESKGRVSIPGRGNSVCKGPEAGKGIVCSWN